MYQDPMTVQNLALMTVDGVVARLVLVFIYYILFISMVALYSVDFSLLTFWYLGMLYTYLVHVKVIFYHITTYYLDMDEYYDITVIVRTAFKIALLSVIYAYIKFTTKNLEFYLPATLIAAFICSLWYVLANIPSLDLISTFINYFLLFALPAFYVWMTIREALIEWKKKPSIQYPVFDIHFIFTEYFYMVHTLISHQLRRKGAVTNLMNTKSLIWYKIVRQLVRFLERPVLFVKSATARYLSSILVLVRGAFGEKSDSFVKNLSFTLIVIIVSTVIIITVSILL